MKEGKGKVSKETVLEVTQEEYDRQIAAGADPETTLRPGKHVFRRGGFMERHGWTPADVQEMMKPKNVKIGVYIKLDLDVLNFFKARAGAAGAVGYQTQINAELRSVMESSQGSEGDTVKTLREVQGLIETVVKQVQRKSKKRLSISAR